MERSLQNLVGGTDRKFLKQKAKSLIKQIFVLLMRLYLPLKPIKAIAQMKKKCLFLTKCLMKLLITVLISALIFCSCAPLRFVGVKKEKITELSIQWAYGRRVNEVYKPKIDSLMNAAIVRFNRNDHTFTVYKAKEGERAGLTIFIRRGRFVSNAGIVAGYVITGVGLALVPAAISAASNGQSIFLFYDLPADRLRYTATLDKSLVTYQYSPIHKVLEEGACFTNKTARMRRICKDFYADIYSILYNLDPKPKELK